MAHVRWLNGGSGPAPGGSGNAPGNGKDNGQSDPPAGGQKKPTPPPQRLGRNPLGWVVLGLMLVMVLLVISATQSAGQNVSKQEFFAQYRDGTIDPDTVVIAQDRVRAYTKAEDAQDQRPVAYAFNPQAHRDVREEIDQLTSGRFEEDPGPAWWMRLLYSPFLWTILLFVIIWLLIARAMRNAAGGGAGMLGSFGKSRHRVLAKESTNVRFTDVAGIDDAKDEVTEIVEFLKNPKRFMKLGGRIPRGVLLVGDPGCGKTLLAKAIAGEADVPFFSISGSDFVEMFVGVGASRVRDLFKQAKESSPCIIFLDEIDAVGRRRGGGFSSGGHDEREQTLNAILVEMDGFESSDQVIVIAATNRADVLDPALTRPGRFDRQVIVPLPDLKGRLEILNVHAKKIKIADDVDLERIARGTPMFSGAELAAIVNEAAILATLDDKPAVEQNDLEEARDKVRYGRSAKSRRVEERERVATAYHEAGHAILQALLPDADPLHKVTIIPRGQSLGATMSLPEKDRYGFGLKWISATMRVVCGGRIAEERATGDVSSGAAMDIQMLTNLARAMVLEWGMSDKLGFVRYAGSDTRESFVREREYSEETAALIDEEIRRFAAQAFDDAKATLDEHWSKVEAVAQALLKHETLTDDEVQALIEGKALDKPTVSELLAAEAARAKADSADNADAKTDDRPADDEVGPGVIPSPA